MTRMNANSPEQPWPVSMVNQKIKGWIERLGFLWVEGQITQVNMKPTWKLSYITLRDVEKDLSIPLTMNTRTLQNLDRKSTRLNSSHVSISYAVFCLKQNMN